MQSTPQCVQGAPDDSLGGVCKAGVYVRVCVSVCLFVYMSVSVIACLCMCVSLSVNLGVIST